jgi:lysozyme
MKISKAGVNLIKEFESFEPHPYVCPAGKLTIGYGHVIKPDEQFDDLTEQEASSLLAKDLTPREEAVHRQVHVKLSQPQFDALVSFVYNVGEGAFAMSTLLHKLNNRDYLGAAGEFRRWKYGGGKELPGLVRRRRREEELFLSGTNLPVKAFL